MSMMINSARFASAGSAVPVHIATSSGANNSLSVNYPGGIVAGDMLIAVIAANGVTDTEYTQPAGWTRLTKAPAAGPGSGASPAILALFYRLADGSETGSISFTRTSTAVNAELVRIVQFRGATGFQGLAAGGTPDNSVTPISTPAITTTGADRLILNFFVGNTATTMTEEAGWTEIFDHVLNGIGANDCAVILHSKDAPTAGTQTTEEPTPATAATAWAFASLALSPSGAPPSASITVRASNIAHVNNASSASVAIPTGSQAGDTCLICTGHGFGATTPTGWAQLNSLTGSNFNGACFHKILTAVDITAGTISVSFAGAYYGAVAAISFVGCTGGFRAIAATRNTSGGSPRTVTTNANPKAGDYAVYFGSERASSATCTVSVGSSLQTLSASNASACLYGGTLGADGAVSANFTYSPTGTGDYQAVIVVAPAPV